MISITVLGTAGMAPTRERNTAGILAQVESEGILFDCGEGIQRQMKIAGISVTKVTHILLSHWHGDHVFGLPGLLQSMGASEYSRILHIFGPKGTKKRFQDMVRLFGLSSQLKIKVEDAFSGVIHENRFFTLSAEPLEHDIPCLGYAMKLPDRRRINLEYTKKIGMKPGPLMGKLQRNQSVEFGGNTVSPKQATYLVEGKKLAYVTDTSYCNNAVKIADEADLLIIEASLTSDLKDKADKYNHLTAKQAGLIAKQANVKEVLLTHFSQRYLDTAPLEEEAKSVFSNSSAAKDFMQITL